MIENDINCHFYLRTKISSSTNLIDKSLTIKENNKKLNYEYATTAKLNFRGNSLP